MRAFLIGRRWDDLPEPAQQVMSILRTNGIISIFDPLKQAETYATLLWLKRGGLVDEVQTIPSYKLNYAGMAILPSK